MHWNNFWRQLLPEHSLCTGPAMVKIFLQKRRHSRHSMRRRNALSLHTEIPGWPINPCMQYGRIFCWTAWKCSAPNLSGTSIVHHRSRSISFCRTFIKTAVHKTRGRNINIHITLIWWRCMTCPSPTRWRKCVATIIDLVQIISHISSKLISS